MRQAQATFGWRPALEQNEILPPATATAECHQNNTNSLWACISAIRNPALLSRFLARSRPSFFTVSRQPRHDSPDKQQDSTVVGRIPSVIARRRHSKAEHVSGAPPLHILRLRSPHSSRPRKPHPWWPRSSPGTFSNPWWPWTFLSRLATAAARERLTPGLGGRKKEGGQRYWASLWLHERRIVLVAALTRQATLRLLESFWGLVCRVDCQRATGYLPISLRTGSGFEDGTVSRSREGRFGH